MWRKYPAGGTRECRIRAVPGKKYRWPRVSVSPFDLMLFDDAVYCRRCFSGGTYKI